MRYLIAISIIVLVFIVLGMAVCWLLGRIADSQAEITTWNSPEHKPQLEGEYLTRYMLGKIEVIEKAIWNGQAWVQELHGRVFECYGQKREWRMPV